MKIVSSCPCCSTPMLHHFRDGKEYWFCRQCWQEMPNLSDIKEQGKIERNRVINLSANLRQRDRAVSF